MNKYNIKDEVAIPNKEYWSEIENKKYELLLNRSNIPNFYHDINFSDYIGTRSIKNVEKVIQYSQECFTKKFDHVHLYLYGGNSTQKTALMCNIGKQSIVQGKRVKFTLSSMIISHLMKLQGFNRDEDSYSYIQSIKQADMILIDDAFSSDKNIMWKNSNNLIISEWDTFLRDLFVSNKKIIMTSNISIDILKSDYGESFYELVDRNCISLQFLDSVKEHKKSFHENLFKE